jgi:hypothetical protein
VDDFLTLDLVGNPSPAVLVAIRGGRRRCGRCVRGRRELGGLRHILPRIEQETLLGIDLFAGAAVQTPQQEVHVVFLPIQTRVGLLQLVEQLHDQLLEHDRVVGQRGKIRQR